MLLDLAFLYIIYDFLFLISVFACLIINTKDVLSIIVFVLKFSLIIIFHHVIP